MRMTNVKEGKIGLSPNSLFDACQVVQQAVEHGMLFVLH
jgi:hypothetical protein